MLSKEWSGEAMYLQGNARNGRKPLSMFRKAWGHRTPSEVGLRVLRKECTQSTINDQRTADAAFETCDRADGQLRPFRGGARADCETAERSEWLETDLVYLESLGCTYTTGPHPGDAREPSPRPKVTSPAASPGRGTDRTYTLYTLVDSPQFT